MQTLSLLFKALADETRLRILWMLRTRSMCVCEIREILQLAFSTVSQHLFILRDAGFIVDSKDGKWVNYSRNSDPGAKEIHALFKLIDEWMEKNERAKSDRLRAERVDRFAICRNKTQRVTCENTHSLHR